MGWEAGIIEFLQSGRNAFLNGLMLAFTQAGDELLFIVIGIILYWCVDKRFAFRFFNVYIFSVAANEGLKAIIRRPRPFDSYDSVVSIGDKTAGYSFPSGHSQSIANIGTQLSFRYKRRWIVICSSVLAAVVMFTRLYLGQHYLTDVLAGAALGFTIALGLSFVFQKLAPYEHIVVFTVVPLCLVLAAVLCFIDYSGFENIFKVLGGYSAFMAGYLLEKKFVRYEVKSGKWYKQVIKTLIGIAVILAVKELLKLVLPANISVLYGFLRYFIVAALASLAFPAFFKAVKL